MYGGHTGRWSAVGVAAGCSLVLELKQYKSCSMIATASTL